MNTLRPPPGRHALIFAGCLALLGLGTITLVPGDRSGGARLSTIAANPVAVDDTIVPPHREPPPPPPPPPPPEPPPPRPATPAGALRASILEALSGSTAGAQSIHVEVEGLGTVLSTNGSTVGIPASLTKLYTGGAAMLRLGNDARFKTEVLAYGEVADGTLNGSLVLVGGGDPALLKADLQGLAAGVAASVRQVTGNLYADDSRFDRERTAPGWRSFYFPDDVGTLSALAVDGNVWRTDPGFFADPALGNLGLFRDLLIERGVTVTGQENIVGRPEGNPAETLVVHSSAPLGSLIVEMMTKSENFYAEMILKELGRSATDPTTAGGVEAIASLTRDLGVAHGRFFDGSGLSIENRESSVNVVEWLKAMDRSPAGNLFRSSLARPCSGSKYLLEKRLCGTPAVGKIQAKTGTLLRSRSVAGYATTASGRKVWFALMLGDVKSNLRAWEAFDRTLVTIATFAR